MSKQLQPLEDYGFFGPDSVVWKVWSYPTAAVTGLQRAVVVEELDPFLVAAVQNTGKNYSQPRVRYDRTVKYFATIALGDTRSAVKASEILVKVHAHNAVGIEPVSGLKYDGNDPASQLWILLTGWHSVLYAYERYGPGPLSPGEELEYWESCAVAAELQTCDPADVPRTREGVREYLEGERARLAVSESTRQMMDHLLNGDIVFPDLPLPLKPIGWIAGKVVRKSTLATIPRWMRELSGFRQSRLTDALVRPLMRASMAVVNSNGRLMLSSLAQLAPSAVPVAGPALVGLPPIYAETRTPAQARQLYGTATPQELHALAS